MPALAASLRRSLPRLRSPLAALLARLSLSRSRARLVVLDDHLLHDIGLTRDEARAEAERPVWDAPAHWIAR